MVSKKPRIVIIGAGMAGLTAANKLYTSPNWDQRFELSVVEGGTRIGGRINSSEFCGDQIELGATWIHGIQGSPLHKIAQETGALHSDRPWECMDGFPRDPITVAEGGHVLSPSFVEPISTFFKNLMDFIQGKPVQDDAVSLFQQLLKRCGGDLRNLSVWSFLRRGLEAYSVLTKEENQNMGFKSWSWKSLQEAVFAMHESIQRTYTSAGDLYTLDCNAEKEYIMFPGEEITIGKGYSSVIENLASVLPVGMIELGKKVERIEWQDRIYIENRHGDGCSRPVKLHFADGSMTTADYDIITVPLGVLKQGIGQDSAMFNPPLPPLKREAISKLGFGVVNKVFLELSQEEKIDEEKKFPFLQMVFHRKDSEWKNGKIPQWIRRTSSLNPIYCNSRIVLSWFTGDEALEIEFISDEQIINGFLTTVSNLLPSNDHCSNSCNGGFSPSPNLSPNQVKFSKVLRTKWGTNPLFLGSYSYVAVGSSGDDMDPLSEPLPQPCSRIDDDDDGEDINAWCKSPQLQILFAGEATHRTHYSTTHGAYFSGLREANRLLKHYNCLGL